MTTPSRKDIQAQPTATAAGHPPAEEAADRETQAETAQAPADGVSGDAALAAGHSVAELEQRWQRALADADNARKRLERQLADEVRAERARTVAALLPVLDNLDLALRHAQADPASIITGLQAVREQAAAVLRQLGYSPTGQAGERFDPARHEAAQVVAADEAEPGTVTAVLRLGYIDARGALVRPAAVVVAGDRRSE